MALSVLVTLFCCLLGGIIAIIKSAQSNNLYTSALAASDEIAKQRFYMESEAKNKSAKTWIIISIVGSILVTVICLAVALAAGMLADGFDGLMDI